MTKENFNAKMTYDFDSDAMGVSLLNRLPKDYKISECLDDNLILDLNQNGDVIGVEILFASEYFRLSKISLKNIKTFNFNVNITKGKIIVEIKFKFNLRNKLTEKDLVFEMLNEDMLTPSSVNLAVIC